MPDSVKKLFLTNTKLFIGLLSIFWVVLLTPFYLNGFLEFIDNEIQDRFYRYKFLSTEPHNDIYLISVNEATTSKLGYPIPRQFYTTAFNKLNKLGVKAIGFNFLISAKNNTKIDSELIDSVSSASNVVMPLFYDYSNGNTATPMKELQQAVVALGNVSIYPDPVARFIEPEILNRNTNPQNVVLPMGVELARQYLDIPLSEVKLEAYQLKLGEKVDYPFERGKLIRLNYHGPPGYFKTIPFESLIDAEIVSKNGKELLNLPTPIELKNKIVLIGSMSPSMGDVTTSPFGNQTQKPVYGIELQAHLIQSLINNEPIYHLNAVFIVFFTLVLGFICGWVLTRFSISFQMMYLFGLVLLLNLASFLCFNVLSLLIDTSLTIVSCVLIGLSLVGMVFIRSSILLNSEIQSLQKIESQLPKPDFIDKIDLILSTLMYISQVYWVSFRRYDNPNKQMVLVDISCRDEEVSYQKLLPYFKSDFLESLPRTVIPLQYSRLPNTLKDSYQEFSEGYFIFLPLFSSSKKLIGMFELYFKNSNDFEDASFELLEDIRGAAAQSLDKLYSREISRTQGVTPGVEEKIASLSRLNQKIHENSAFFQTVLKSTTNPIVVCNQLGEISFYNENFANSLRLELGHNLTKENIMELMSKTFNLQGQQWQDIWNTIIHKRKQKEVQVMTQWGVYHLSLTPVIDDYEVTGVVMLLTDVTNLHRQANYDKLTGLYNRRFFDELLLKEFQRCQRNPERPFSLILMDIDHFKSFNDTYGHQVGDQVLASFGQVLARTVRKTDMAVRYGGEEMAVILPTTTLQGAAIAAEKVRSSVESMQLYDLEGEPIRQITTSIGVTEFVADDSNVDDIIKRADDALYKCKEGGRNCIHIHTTEEIIKFIPGKTSAQISS